MRISFLIVVMQSSMVVLLLANEVKSQNVDLQLSEASIITVFSAIEQQSSVNFVYDEQEMRRVARVTIHARQTPLDEVLKDIKRQVPIQFKKSGDMIGVTLLSSNKVAIPDQLTGIIKGRITDAENGAPLSGANVFIKETTRGVAADADGYYRIENLEPDTYTLVVTFLGYKRVEQEVTVNVDESVSVNFELETVVGELGEVVVNAGYYSVEEKKLTGNISRVTAQTIDQQPVTNSLQSLQGRMPGVFVSQSSGLPGGGFSVQIRGLNSLGGGNAPLYIVDGVPYDMSSLQNSSFRTAGISGSPLNSISPGDIESIEVLKDADATAIYGSRGANGVVLITTKQGDPGETRVDVEYTQGIGQLNGRMDLLNTEQYLEMRTEAFANDDAEPGNTDYDLNGAWDQNRYTDWQEVLLGGTSHQTNTHMSVSGGTAALRFTIRGNYHRETTIFPGSFSYQRGSGHVFLSHTGSDDKFRATLSVNLSADKNNLPQDDLTGRAVSLPPNAPELYTASGELNWANSTWLNPIADLRKTYQARNKSLISHAEISYQPIEGLYLKTGLGYTIQQIDQYNGTPIRSKNPAFGEDTGVARFADNESRNWIIEPQAEYEYSIGSGEIRILLGGALQGRVREGKYLFGTGYTTDALLGNINAAAEIESYNSNYNEYLYGAIFGRVNYEWDSKYILNLTARRDGSSRFGPGKRFGNFGAAGAAWLFSEEAFIQDALPFLTFGKIRVSYGTVGNDQIGDYQYLNSYGVSRFTYQGARGLIPSRLANAEYAWEVNRKLETGLDLGLFEDQLNLGISWYRNRSGNQLIGKPLPLTTGFSSIQANFPATVQNTGFEFEISAVPLQTDNFRWTTTANMTIPNNEIIEFPNIENTNYRNQYKVGASMRVMHRLRYMGVDPETGIYQFEDVNNDGFLSVEDDRQFLEALDREFYGGVGNTFSYRGFQLNMFVQFVKQMGSNYLSNFAAPGQMSNQPEYVMDRWQQPGDETDIQRFTQTEGNSTEISKAYTAARLYSNTSFEDASFIRLNNLSLSYRLPSSLNQSLHLHNSRIYLQGQNLLTITNYKGLDPETQSTNRQPPLRVLAAGIQLTF